MKTSIKALLTILGVLLLVFLVIQYTKRGNKSKSLKSELVSVDTASVSKVEVFSQKGTVVLQRDPDGWNVLLDGRKKKTKAKNVGVMLNSLNNIKPGRLAARKSSKWKDYSVDSTGTRVILYEGDKVVTDLVLGRFGVEGQQSFYTFVRLYEEENVYVANNFMKMSIYENADDYRDNVVLRLKKDSLTSISFDYPDSAFQLTKSDNWYLGNNLVDSAFMAGYLQGLNFLSSKNFYDGDLPESSHTIRFSYSNKTDVVLEGARTVLGLAIQSSENKNEVFLDESLAEKVFKVQGVFRATLD